MTTTTTEITKGVWRVEGDAGVFQVFKSVDPSWNKWAVVAPGMPTAWLKSEEEALNTARSLATPLYR